MSDPARPKLPTASASTPPPPRGDQLSKTTSIFGLHLGVVVGICAGAAFVLLLFFLSIWLTTRRNKASRRRHKPAIPVESREIQEIRIDPSLRSHGKPASQASAAQLVSVKAEHAAAPADSVAEEEKKLAAASVNKPASVAVSGKERGGGSSGERRSAEQGAAASPAAGASVPEVSHLGWGHWYTLRELEEATNGFTPENVIGEGGYGIVYHGVLEDKTNIAVKNLLNNRGQAEREFKVEVEAIGRVRHKNLVRLLGYCAEGAHRMLVYEYVDNGNLEQWLHGEVGPVSPLSWDIRMNIILGTAKGLMYLHEGLEPKVVHRDVKASNILLDKQWTPKVSDFGLAKLLGSERTYVTTRVMGTFGYVAPEYASTGMLNERSDVYSFGILIMEIISGRVPVDYSRPPGEVNLIEWLKVMVSNRNTDGVIDPKMPEPPNSRALKRTLLVALRCVDPDSTKRPKMGHVIHMLEVDDFPYRDERRPGGVPPGRMQFSSPQGRAPTSVNQTTMTSTSNVSESLSRTPELRKDEE